MALHNGSVDRRSKVNDVTMRFLLPILLVAGVASAQPVPHQSDGMPYDDELYRELIFDDYDRMGTNRGQSWVLPYKNPRFFIRLGSATECAHNWRLSWRELHYWRAVVPIVAEQLTGTPYLERVRAGCEDRQPEYGWVIVRYVTPAEYSSETGEQWGGDQIDARALIGDTHGQVWIRWNGSHRPLSDGIRELIVHEIGHAFGLYHTGRQTATMNWDAVVGDTFPVFSGAEEAAARRAYRAGRGARYCGDPDRCGNGFAPGYVPTLDARAPVAVD